MKLAGVILILIGAAWGYLRYRRTVLQSLRLSKALADDLAVLRCQICIHRRSLPVILAEELGQGIGSDYFWSVLSDLLERSRGSVRSCWESAADGLPAPLDACLAPLGVLIPVGGNTLADAIEEVRSELLRYVRTLEEQHSVRLRLAAAMYFASASLFILVCI